MQLVSYSVGETTYIFLQNVNGKSAIKTKQIFSLVDGGTLVIIFISINLLAFILQTLREGSMQLKAFSTAIGRQVTLLMETTAITIAVQQHSMLQ